MTALGVHSDRARPALVRLATEDPALGALALWCAHRDAPLDAGWTGPARTEGRVIWYAPGFAQLAPHEQTGVAAHHILHVALRHGARMGDMAARLGDGFDETLYGIAADALVNEALLAAGHALPRPALTLTDLLTRALGRAGGPGALADWDVDRLYLQLTGQGSGSGGDPASGKTARPAQQARAVAAAAGFAPDVRRDLPDRENPDGADQAALWRQHLARALETGRLAGRGIGTIGHHIADIPEPRTPWEHHLRRLLSRALLPGLTQTHRRPARDWIAAESLARSTGSPIPAFRPGQRRSRDVPQIVLAVDASGSVEAALLQRFLSEVSGIARRVAAEITLLAFDDGVRWQVRLDPVRRATQVTTLDWPRGGGTDFAPPVAAAVAARAAALVVLTDMEGRFGAAPRGLPVFWAAVGRATSAPFGQVLSLDR